MAATITGTPRKSRGYLILDEKLKKKKFKKVNRDITFRPEKNLQSILYQNKPKLLSTSHPKVYQLDCLCNGRYIGKSKKKVLTRCIEHQLDSMRGNWESSSH